jgi:hypothetical protein
MVVSEHDGLDLRTPQRRFPITDSGEAYLEFWANSLARYQKVMDCSSGPTTPRSPCGEHPE